MGKTFGHYGDEFITSHEDPSIQLLKVPGRIQEVNITMWSWRRHLPEFFGPASKKPGHDLCFSKTLHDVTNEIESVDVHSSILSSHPPLKESVTHSSPSWQARSLHVR
jgi:hypothetical protein